MTFLYHMEKIVYNIFVNQSDNYNYFIQKSSSIFWFSEIVYIILIFFIFGIPLSFLLMIINVISSNMFFELHVQWSQNMLKALHVKHCSSFNWYIMVTHFNYTIKIPYGTLPMVYSTRLVNKVTTGRGASKKGWLHHTCTVSSLYSNN